MFLLNKDGVIISLDFTKIANSRRRFNIWFLNYCFSDLYHFYGYSLFVSVTILVVFVKLYKRPERQPDLNRNTNEINQVIQDIIRLNNLQMAVANNLQTISQNNTSIEQNTGNNGGENNNPVPNDDIQIINDDNINIINNLPPNEDQNN